MARKYLEILTKLIFFYSLFYIVMKIIAILFQNLWAIPNLILTLPYILFAAIGGLLIKKKRYSWIYVIIGALVISLIRYYEAEWVVRLHETFS